MRLLIRHSSRYHYGPDGQRLTFILRLWPPSVASQRVIDWSVSANGVPVAPAPDGSALLTLQPVPDTLDILAEGIVETIDVAGVLPATPRDPHPAIFLKDTALTRADPAITALAQQAGGEGALSQIHNLNGLIYDAIAYRAGTTGTGTTAAEALAQGTGVCQDHAHIFIAAARSLNIPARYVAGYLLAGEGEHALHETHAWAEAFVDGLGWIGFDPSNKVCPDEHYVRLTTGLDASDAAMIRGHVVGGSNIGIDADVRITPSQGGDGEAGQQQQQQQQQ